MPAPAKPPKPLITVAEGYKIHIELSEADRETFERTETIAESRGLTYFQNHTWIMIYRKQ